MACVHGVWRKVFPKIDFFHYKAKLFVIAIFYVTFIAGKKVLGRVSKFGVFVFTFTRNEQDDFDEMLKGVQENC
jgi:hypothetical protein|tara:strand:- start:98 stop:319 length:222 start_codon:yes stop_codon:yes gene_type:complete